MNLTSDIILDHAQISRKLVRLAWQVYENNMDEQVIWLAGIDKRGMYVAERVAAELSAISPQKVVTFNILSGHGQEQPRFVPELGENDLKDAVVILTDDVLNTGKTMMQAMIPLLQCKVRKVQVLVLASRSHRLFPVRADFVGISMATTLQEHLSFDNSDGDALSLSLS